MHLESNHVIKRGPCVRGWFSSQPLRDAKPNSLLLHHHHLSLLPFSQVYFSFLFPPYFTLNKAFVVFCIRLSIAFNASSFHVPKSCCVCLNAAFP